MGNILNKPCVCGSKKKYKFCCKQRFVKFNKLILTNLSQEINENCLDQLEQFKNHYSKFVTSFYVELAKQGIKNLNSLAEKYDGFWRDYCNLINIDYPERERYFIANLAKNLGAELTESSSYNKEQNLFKKKSHFLESI